jgi:hypothetical protein
MYTIYIGVVSVPMKTYRHVSVGMLPYHVCMTTYMWVAPLQPLQ